MNFGKRSLQYLLFLCASLAFVSCSPASFFGNQTDQALQNNNNYRQVNAQCSNIQITGSTVDTPTFVKLVDCFNNDGGLKEIADLAHKMTTEELDPFVQMLNKYLLYDGKVLAQVDQSFHDMDGQKTIDPVLTQLGALLDHDDLLIHSIALLKELYYKSSGILLKPTVDTELLQALTHLSTQVDAASVASGIDSGLNLTESKAFQSLEGKLKGSRARGRSLQDIVQAFVDYQRMPIQGKHTALGKALLDKVSSGELLPVLDELVGVSEADLQARISRTASYLDVSLQNGGEIFNGMSRLFGELDGPIHCMDNTLDVPNAALWVIDELSQRPLSSAAAFIQRDNKLMLASLNSLCNFPALSSDYGQAVALANTTAIEPGVEFIQKFHDHHLSKFLLSILEDDGIPKLSPGLGELRDRGGLQDLLLVASLTKLENRQSLYGNIKTLTEPVAEMGGKSVLDVVSNALARVSPVTLYNVANDLSVINDSNTVIVGPLLRALRSAYYTDDTHPFVEIAHKVLKDSNTNQALLTSLFSIYDRKDFRDAIQLFAKISKSGRMREIMRTMLAIFKPLSTPQNLVINLTAEPKYQPARRHNLAAADLAPFVIGTEPTVANDDCKNLDPMFAIDQYTNGNYVTQLKSYLGCLNSNHEHAGAVSAISYLDHTQTELGTSYLGWMIDLMKGLQLNQNEFGFFSKALVSNIDNGRIDQILGALPYWITKTIDGNNGISGGTLIQPLLAFFDSLKGADQIKSLRDLEGYLAKVLRRSDAVGILQYADGLSQLTPDPVTAVDLTTYPTLQIHQALINKECVTSSPNIKTRSDELIADYKDAVNGWELVNGEARRSWSASDMRPYLDQPILQRMADPSQSDPHKPVMKAMLNVLGYFNLPEGQEPNSFQHYPKGYLQQWLSDRAFDPQPVQYFYPGQDLPQIRLVSSLDRLELVLVNADYKAPIFNKNFALQFIEEIGESWGDEPESVWPPEIVAKVRRTGQKPKTIQETVNHINQTQKQFEGQLGFPAVQDCVHGGTTGGSWVPGFTDVKQGLFNTHQIISILNEAQSIPHICSREEKKAGSCVLNANGHYEQPGLKILRDIFFELYYSTPSQYRIDDAFAGDALACIALVPNSNKAACAGDHNNLSVALKMVRLGLFREIGKQLKYFEPSDAVLGDMMSGLIDGATAPATVQMMKTLTQDDPGQTLFWNTLTAAFKVGDSSDARWMKQEIFYLLAGLEQLKLVTPGVQTLSDILSGYHGFLAQHTDQLQTALTSHGASELIRALYEDQNMDAKSHLQDLMSDALSSPTHAMNLMFVLQSVATDSASAGMWDAFKGRYDALQTDPGYVSLHLEQVTQDLKDFVLERSTTPGAVETSERVRAYLADLLENKKLDQIVLLAAKDPKGLYSAMTALSNEAGSGSLKQFIALVRSALNQPSPR